MSSGFNVSNFFIPTTYDTNNDKNLSTNEIKIFCSDNALQYDVKTQKIIPLDTDNCSDDTLKLNVEKYSIESIKQRYPEDNYTISEYYGFITVIDKNTGNIILNVTKGNNRTYIDMFDENGKSVYFRSYDKNGTLLFYGKDNKRHCQIADNIYKAVSAKKLKCIPSTDVNNLILNVKSITPDNYCTIASIYEETYGETLIEAIKNEYGLDGSIKTGLINHLNKCVYECLKTEIDSPDTKINKDFEQGKIGDCWFLASIAAIQRSPKGQEILNNMITDNRDGTYTVRFKGSDKEYTVEVCEILDKGNYATGDLDVRILELAAEKHYNLLGIKYGGNPSSGLELLLGTGDRWKNLARIYYPKPNPEKIKELLENPNIVMTTEINPCSKLWGYIVKDIPQDADYKDEIAMAHAYAIVGIDDENIHIKNPWHTGNVIKIPLDVFEEYYVGVQYTEIK